MNQYVTGATIKRLREKQNITQARLAEMLGVSDKAVSKWETGRGFPDISFLEPLSALLKVSAIELLSGNEIINQNKNANLTKSQFYVCPVCGNVLYSVGTALVSCCGIQLPPLEIEADEDSGAMHGISMEHIEDEYFVSVNHEMSKTHYISWLAMVTCNSVEVVKLYPEQNAEARFKIKGMAMILAYCNRHGLFEAKRK